MAPSVPQIKCLGVHPLCWHSGCQPLPITPCLFLSSARVRPPDPWGDPPLGAWLCFGEADVGPGGAGLNAGEGGGLQEEVWEVEEGQC